VPSFFSAAITTDLDETGGQRYTVSGSLTEPSDKSAYRGVRIVARPSGTTGSADSDLMTCPLGTASYQSRPFAMPDTAATMTILAFSTDAAGRSNTYVDGVTPAVSVTASPAVTGSLKLSRAAANQLGKGLYNAGGQIYIPANAIDSTLLALQSVFGQNLYNGPLIGAQHLSDYIVGQSKLQNAQIVDMARIVDGNITRLKIGLGVIDSTLIANAGIQSANILNLNTDKLNVSGSINCASGSLTLSGAQGVNISNGGSLVITPGSVLAFSFTTNAASGNWSIVPGIAPSISGSGYVNANGGFKVNGTAGLTTTVGVVDSLGTPHNLCFSGGILTGTS
jgi:hypothetical protein